MKHTFKTVSTVLVALGMTVCSVTALATNASAANDTNKNAPDSVGYTVDTSHNFDHQSSTDSTSVEGVTREPYSMAERPKRRTGKEETDYAQDQKYRGFSDLTEYGNGSDGFRTPCCVTFENMATAGCSHERELLRCGFFVPIFSFSASKEG